MAVLAATLTSSVVFFPVTFLYGVSRFLFSALALAVVLALFASYFVAMTVVPLFCARFLKAPHHGDATADARRGPVGTTVQSRRSRGGSNGCWLVRTARPAVAAASGARGRGDHGGVRGQPHPLSAARRGVLPAHRRRPVRDERQGAVRQPPRSHDGGGEPRRGARAAHGRTARPRPDRVEHRRAAGLLVALHEQRRPAHGDRAGGAQREASRRQLRIHVADAAGDAGGTAAPERVLPVGRHRGRGAQSGPAGADRRAAERVEHRGRLRGRGVGMADDDPQAARRQRRLHPAGHRLPVAAARHRSRAGRVARPQPARGRRTTSSRRSRRTR